MIGQIGRDLGVTNPKSALLIGDARQDFGRDLYRTLEKVVNDNQNRALYWILVATKPLRNDPHQIMSRVIICPHEPPKMLGTICWKISNKSGRAERLWVLPLDIPRMIETVDPGQFVPEVARAAEGMPILH